MGFVAERFEWRVEQFIDESVERAADFLARAIVERPEFIEQSQELVGLRFVGAFLEPFDRRAGRAMVQFAHEPLGFLFDDVLGPRPFLLTRLAVFVAHFPQVVDRVQIHAMTRSRTKSVRWARRAAITPNMSAVTIG